jgi:hypothetical protein
MHNGKENAVPPLILECVVSLEDGTRMIVQVKICKTLPNLMESTQMGRKQSKFLDQRI